MRVCIEKTTGKIIEAQAYGTVQEDLQPLIANAIKAGYSVDDIEAKYMAEPEYYALIKQQCEKEKSYADKRRAEYPPITDYIDGIIKGDTVQVQTYINACLAVKSKYPKV